MVSQELPVYSFCMCYADRGTVLSWNRDRTPYSVHKQSVLRIY